MLREPSPMGAATERPSGDLSPAVADWNGAYERPSI